MTTTESSGPDVIRTCDSFSMQLPAVNNRLSCPTNAAAGSSLWHVPLLSHRQCN